MGHIKSKETTVIVAHRRGIRARRGNDARWSQEPGKLYSGDDMAFKLMFISKSLGW